MRKPNKRRKPVPTPAPPRPGRKEKPPLPAGEEWLDAIDPERTRYGQPVSCWPRYVTRNEATEWLLHLLERQRTQKPRSLRNFEADMREGYWLDGVANIVFDRHGYLINGQHVLTALIHSNLEKILCIVVINRIADAYLGYDLGIKRSLADNLKGETEAPGAVGKVLNVLRQWDKGLYTGDAYVTAREGSIQLAGRRSHELLALTPGVEKHLFKNPFRTNHGYRSVAAMHAASYRLHQIDPEKAKEFFECFTTGASMPPGHPVLALRKKFTGMDKNERWRSGPTLAYILDAWNLFVAGEKVTRLPFRMGQPFPEVSLPLPLPASSRSSAKIQ
jgi:hypothetical protein